MAVNTHLYFAFYPPHVWTGRPLLNQNLNLENAPYENAGKKITKG